MKLRAALRENADTLVFGSALAVIGALTLWWGVFSRRLVVAHAALSIEHARAMVPYDQRAAVEASIAARAEGQLLMIAAEGLSFAALLVVCVAALFVVGRRRRASKQRLERLLSFTTHELKTPIAGVRALLQSLQLGSIPKDAQAGFLAQGIGECDRLEHLVETILAYQRAAARPRRVRARGEDLVTEVLEHRRRTLGDEQVVRERAAGGDGGPEVLVDRDAYRVVLENLLDNARKYGSGASRLVERHTADRFVLELTDHGVGFPPEDAERLFDPFARGEQAGGGSHGSGLGLFISRQLARGMGGELSARSAGHGTGATFTFEVPHAPPAEGVTGTSRDHRGGHAQEGLHAGR